MRAPRRRGGALVPPCGTPQKVRVAKLGGDEVYAEDSAVGTGAQVSVTEELWKVEGKRLVSIGDFAVAGSAGGIENEEHWLYEMTATANSRGHGAAARDVDVVTPRRRRTTGEDAEQPAQVRARRGKLKALSPEGAPAMR